MSSVFAGVRRRLGALGSDESGAAALFAVVSLMFLVVVVAYVHNVGMTVNRRIRLQNAADAAAYSGAMVEANSLSAIAWLNSCQTYIHARMQESILEMMPLVTGAATVQWGRYVYDTFRNGPRRREDLLAGAPHSVPRELQELHDDFKKENPDAFDSGGYSPNTNMDGMDAGTGESMSEKLAQLENEYAAAKNALYAAEDRGRDIQARLNVARGRLPGAANNDERQKIQNEIAFLEKELAAANEQVRQANEDLDQAEKELEEANKQAEDLVDNTGMDRELSSDMESIAKENKDKRPAIEEDKLGEYWEKPHDPPPVTASLMFIPGVGDAVGAITSAITGSKARTAGPIVTNGGMVTLSDDFPGDESVKEGAPPWEEFKYAMAGYYPGAVPLWQARMAMLFNAMPNSTDDLVKLVKEKALPLVKTWVGSRSYDDKGNATESGSRPGETWIRQLSTVAAAIARAMPEMVRNEMLYSLSVNAPPDVLAAIYPAHDGENPDDGWGKVAFAEYDRDDGEAFFRYDHFAMPKPPWARPPYWTNSYPLAAEIVSRGLSGISSGNGADVLGYEEALRGNNPALWLNEEDDTVYGNRFLHEARRQNARMRSVTPNDLLAKVGVPVEGLGDVELLAYAEKETEARSFGYPPHLRMKLANTFYYDEYAGRPGRDDHGKGDGFALRKMSMGWNRNDRYWQAPSEDTEDRRTGMFSNYKLGWFRIPVPFWLPKGSFGVNPNFNTRPRDTLGYAPGSSVAYVGHLPFVRAHGDAQTANDAADGHWHYEHYHSSSINDNHSFPNAFCPGINCILGALFKYMFGARSQWEGNVHAPYKHWDGWTGDDEGDAAKYHIHSQINDDNEGKNGIYNLGGAEAPGERKHPERIPVSTYNLCLGCKTYGFWFIRWCGCGSCSSDGRHGSLGDSSFPKDLMPLYNTPVLWIGDYNPHWLSAIGAWLTWGDLEGDPTLFFGCGDPYFYDWLYMGANALAEDLSEDNPFTGTLKDLLQDTKTLHEIYPFDLTVFDALGSVTGFNINELGGGNSLEFLKSDGAMKIATALFDTFNPRTGHHRFLQDPLTMSECPLCGERHLGGDWGPHENASLLNRLLDTGDRRVDAGMAYSQVLKGHDLAPGSYGKPDADAQGAMARSALDFDFDIDDGLASGKDWTQNFAADRFVREWSAPDSNPEFAPAVVLTENFFRHGVSVALVDRYRPVFGMFGAERVITAVATARVGFIERLPDGVFPDSPGDGKGAGDLPQIITGADEAGADGRVWDLDRIWSEFIDFPNRKPEVESNLYYADYGVKLVSTRYAILANRGEGDNARRATDNSHYSMEDAEIAFWKEMGALTCRLPDGTATETTLADAMLPGGDWDKFASEYVQSRYAMEEDVR